MIDGGYFGKQIAARPDTLDAAGVREICSVSHCISTAPVAWIEQWRHNGFGWFDRVADAVAVLPPAEESRYRVFAYRVHPRFFRAGAAYHLPQPTDVAPDPVPGTFMRRGFDAVSRSRDTAIGFECSPLSCNGLASGMAVNEYCLFPSLDAAVAAASRFSIEQPEPGDYYVVEVLEAPTPAASGPL